MLGVESHFLAIHFPSKVADFVIMVVFYKFIYEMRVVKLKLKCDEYKDYKRQLKCQRCIWTGFYVILSLRLAFELVASFFSSEDRSTRWRLAYILTISSNIIGILMNQVLIVLLYFYFCFFFQKKKEALTKQYGVFTRKQKCVVIWCVLVMCLNGFNIFVNSGI